MDSVAFNLFGIEIMWYGIFIVVGALLGAIISTLLFKRDKEFDKDIYFNIFIIALVMGIVGARIYYVIFNLELYNSLGEMLNIRSGGLAFHGGVILGTLSAYIYLRVKKEPSLLYIDALTITALVGQALGRWGNFFNQEAYGREVSEKFISNFPLFIKNGMHINGLYFHPTFLYESFSNFVIVIFLILVYIKFGKSLKRGSIFALGVILNSFMRIFIESLRMDSLYLGSHRVAQIVGILGVFLGIVLFIFLNKDKFKKEMDHE